MDDLILIKYNDLIVLKCIRAVTGGGRYKTAIC